MLEAYPKLSAVIAQLDVFLKAKHDRFFGPSATHPHSAVKPYKVIHDDLWGTNRFSWRELVLLDTPILQRLRNIHQTGLAYHVYPSARHSRFEHSLGVVVIASRIFDSLAQRYSGRLEDIADTVTVDKSDKPKDTIARLRQELRLAALLHDAGHSIHSHASERVYSDLGILKDAARELTSFAGKEEGAGEVISFCLARTDAVAELLNRAQKKIITGAASGDTAEFVGDIDLENVALLIVGRSKHPQLQFMGDIISSGYDADKLDYLIRDASAAGLPLKYDLERYLYTVYLEQEELGDGDGELEKLYKSVGAKVEHKPPREPDQKFPYFESNRLRLPKQAISTIEQIVICKLMLFSYIYHHQKVRSAEGLLAKLLARAVNGWNGKGESDGQILERFLSMDDSALHGTEFLLSEDESIRECSYRIIQRLLPREVYRFSSTISHPSNAKVKDFFASLQDKTKRPKLVRDIEEIIGNELAKLDTRLSSKSSEDALWTAGVWVDVPKLPRFEDMKVIIGKTAFAPGVPIADVFPISEWVQAYESHRFYVRIYAFSEYADYTVIAARKAMEDVMGVTDDTFYQACQRLRGGQSSS